jgi:predicted MFS family arabinose efflux permease
MSAASPPAAPVRSERTILVTLAAVQFTHILDYMIIMPLGFAVATLACALAPTHPALLAARVAAGVCGGLAGAVVVAMVGDVVPPERRGRGMAFVMSAFPLASVAGVPLGITLSNRFGWHASFFLRAAAPHAAPHAARNLAPASA